MSSEEEEEEKKEVASQKSVDFSAGTSSRVTTASSWLTTYPVETAVGPSAGPL